MTPEIIAIVTVGVALAGVIGAIDIREHEVAVHGFGEGRNLSAMLWFVPA